jgi:hypothetical protein
VSADPFSVCFLEDHPHDSSDQKFKIDCILPYSIYRIGDADRILTKITAVDFADYVAKCALLCTLHGTALWTLYDEGKINVCRGQLLTCGGGEVLF